MQIKKIKLRFLEDTYSESYHYYKNCIADVNEDLAKQFIKDGNAESLEPKPEVKEEAKEAAKPTAKKAIK